MTTILDVGVDLREVIFHNQVKSFFIFVIYTKFYFHTYFKNMTLKNLLDSRLITSIVVVKLVPIKKFNYRWDRSGGYVVTVLGPFAVNPFAVGHFAVGHFAVRTVRRTDRSPYGPFAVRTVRRTDRSP